MVTSLEDIDGLGDKTAEKLRNIGINNPAILASCTPEEIAEAGISKSRARDFREQARESSVIVETGEEAADYIHSLNHISTGVDKLDDILDGGWREEDIICLYGDNSTGKSQLSFKAMTKAVEETGAPAVYIETEKNRYDPDRLSSLADEDEIQKKIYRISVRSLEEQLSALNTVMALDEEISMVVVDSLTMRFRTSEKYDGMGNLSERSTEMKKHVKKLEEISETIGCPVIYTGQIYEDPDPFSGETVRVYGGSLLRHFTSYFVRMEDSSGNVKKATIENNSSKGPEEVELNITDNDINSI